MNIRHFNALVLLRWRLRINQIKKGGFENAILLGLFAVAAGLGVIAVFAGSFAAGYYGLSKAPATIQMFIWDGAVFMMLIFFGIGVLIDLQRSESLSIEKFLHLPVSLSDAFVINYLSSLSSLCMLAFTPMCLGAVLGWALATGPMPLLLIPAVLAFLFMVTALIYQFQGWLATLMTNKRTRRTVIVVVTMAFVLMCQLPNLVNVVAMNRAGRLTKNAAPVDDIPKRVAEVNQEFAEKKITFAERERRVRDISSEGIKRQQERTERTLARVAEIAGIVNLAVPFGWLPLSASRLAGGVLFAPLLATAGLGSIGGLCLWRAYRTTVLFRTGALDRRKKLPKRAEEAPHAPAAPGFATVGAAPAGSILDREIRGLSEPAAATFLGGFISLWRLPEAKMIFISPIILLLVMGFTGFQQAGRLGEYGRYLVASGAMAFVLLMFTPVMGNTFALDRSGFRTYVLSPASRSSILIGKNLAAAPFAGGIALIALIVIQSLAPMRLDLVIAIIPQFFTMYCIYCVLANGLSIAAPMALAPGSLKARSPKPIPIVLQLLFSMVIMPSLALAILPLGAEYVLRKFGYASDLPVCLALNAVCSMAAYGIYRLLLLAEGRWLAVSERRILDVVAIRDE